MNFTLMQAAGRSSTRFRWTSLVAPGGHTRTTIPWSRTIAEILTQVDPLDADPLRLQAHLDEDQVHVRIFYTGSWNTPTDPEQSQHRLTLIRALTDHASFYREGHAITVYLTTCREPPPKRDGYPS